jgi:L-asparaginase
VAASDAAAGLGTLVVLNDQIHAARFVQKVHTALPSAFASPTAGPLGHVVEGSATILVRPARSGPLTIGHPRRRPPTQPPQSPQSSQSPPSPPSPQVALVRFALGDDGRILRALPSLGFAGAVIEGMGAGHVPAGVAPLFDELVAAMPVVLASRVSAGPAFRSTYGYAGAEMDLLARGAIHAGLLGGLKSRVLLTLLVRGGAGREVIEREFRQRSG